MNIKNFMGEITAQKPEVQSKVVVYYVASKFSYATEVKSIEFSNKENADTFINLMKAEGYEITQFAGEGYLGEEAEAKMKDEKAQEIYAFYKAKVEDTVESWGTPESQSDELDLLETVKDLYEAYHLDIESLYECSVGVEDGFALDLTCLGDEFFIEPNPGIEAMHIQFDRLYDRIEELKYVMEFEPVAR